MIIVLVKSALFAAAPSSPWFQIRKASGRKLENGRSAPDKLGLFSVEALGLAVLLTTRVARGLNVNAGRFVIFGQILVGIDPASRGLPVIP
jgi:hypothetical protein